MFTAGFTIMNIPINENYEKLDGGYLFAEIAKRVRSYEERNGKKPISLGVGDVSLPLSQCVVTAMKDAANELGRAETFRGYPPYFGYDFLRGAIRRHYARFGVLLDDDEIFVSDGAKSDSANFGDILGDAPVFVCDPVYPVYEDANIMAGRRVTRISAAKENGFVVSAKDFSAESAVIYLCSPNNPTGAVYDKNVLSEWVEKAKNSGSLIIFDSSYQAYIVGDEPRSIFEIDGADECAVEISSLSKTAGFTGVRCSWTVVPKKLLSRGRSINEMWARRQSTKFNGVSYVTQRAAEAALSYAGYEECRKNIDYYMENARLIMRALSEKGVYHTGGKNSPYVWAKCPRGLSSREFFDAALECGVVCTPGSGFGSAGEGYFRLTAFNTRQNTINAVSALSSIL